MPVQFVDIRRIEKRTTTRGVVPTIPDSNDHTDGTWLITDIYEGELFLNLYDKKVFTRIGSTILTVVGAGQIITTATYTPQSIDCGGIIHMNDNAARTVTMPNPVLFPQMYPFWIKDGALVASNNAKKITINPFAGELIEGQSSQQISVNGGTMALYTDGLNWFIWNGSF